MHKLIDWQSRHAVKHHKQRLHIVAQLAAAQQHMDGAVHVHTS